MKCVVGEEGIVLVGGVAVQGVSGCRNRVGG